MPSRALVIGAESYPKCTTGLTGKVLPGAVADALHFWDWLVVDAKLKPEDIWLHLEPATGPPTEAHPRAQSASYQSIWDSIFALRNDHAGQTERLFVFFAGHGFAFGSDIASRPEDVLVCTDFVDLRRSGNRTIRIGELLAVLAGLGPGEQYYFFDACRNQVSPAELAVGSLGINLVPSPLGPPSQFALFATAAGLTATAPTPFADALVGGLRGAGQAKQWVWDDAAAEDGGGERLSVNFQSLFRYVSSCVNEKCGQQPAMQVWGDSQGELAVLYPPGPEPLTDCRVTVTGVAADDTVIATALIGQMTAGSVRLVGGSGVLPLRTALPYVVTVNGGAKYMVTPPRRAAPMFQALTLVYKATVAPISFSDPGFEDPIEHPAQIAPPANIPVTVFFAAPTENPLTEVTVCGRTHAADGSSAKVERPAQRAEPSPLRQPAWQAALLPGFYQATLWEAGKPLDKQDFSVAPTEQRPKSLEIVFQLPAVAGETHQSLQRSIMAGAHAALQHQIATSADCSLPAWLALLAMDLAWPLGAEGSFLAALLPHAEGEPGLLALVVCDRASKPEPQVTWTFAGTEFQEHPEVPGLHGAFIALPPGAHHANLNIAEQPVLLPLATLPGRLTVVVVVASREIAPSYNLYMLPARRAVPSLDAAESIDFVPASAARILAAAEYSFTRRLALPSVRWADPLLLLMQAYTEIRRGNPVAAAALVTTLRRYYPTLADVTLLARWAGIKEELFLLSPPLFREGLLMLSTEEQKRLGCPPPANLSWSGPFTRWTVPR